MKKKLLPTIFLLISFGSFPQQGKIDSLKVVLRTSTVDTVKLNTYNALITQYAGKDISLAEKYVDTMIQLSKRIKSKRHELTAYSQQGILRYRQGKTDEAVSIWRKGLMDKEIGRYPKQKSNFLNNIAVGYKALKEKDSVLKYLTAGIRLNEAEKNDIGLIGNYSVISNFFFEEKEYDKAIEYLDKLQSVALRTDDKLAIARTNILLASISRKEYDFQGALDYFNTALAYFLEEEPNNQILIRGLKYEGIRTKLRQKRFNETIVELKKLKEEYESQLEDKTFWNQVNLDLLISYYNTSRINEAYPLYKSISETEVNWSDNLEGIKLSALSKFEILSGHINNSTLSKLTLAYNIAKKSEMGDQLLLCTNLLALYHLKKNNTDLSYNYLMDADRIRDSLSFSESKIINLSQKRKFNEALKEKENLTLKRQNAEQALLTEKAKSQKTFMAGSLAISVAGLGIFFLVYYRNQKQKREIEKQKILVEELQRELHHRLKNNLSFIDFFITLAKGKFPDPAYREKLDELQNRINSMFEVHKQLFKKKDVTSVNAKTYISALAENVKKVYSRTNITLKENVQETNLRADTSFPIGLIVNEFLTNSYKYAFPNDEMGVITISFKEDEEQYYLSLSDTGRGLPPNFNIDALDTFGMETIKLLTQEYNGVFKVDGTQGVKMNISFPKKVA